MSIDWTRLKKRKIVDEPQDMNSADSSDSGQDQDGNVTAIMPGGISAIQDEAYARGFNEGAKLGAEAEMSMVRAKALEEGYIKGYTEAYHIAQQCITAYEGSAGPYIMTYLKNGATFDEARDTIAEGRAKESARTAIRSAIMPDDGIEPEPAPRRQSVTAQERNEIYATVNGAALNPWNIQPKRG